MGEGAFLEHEVAFAAVGGEEAIADEAFADAGDDAELAEPLHDREGGGENVGRGRDGSHHLDEPHDVGGGEEVQADEAVRVGDGAGQDVGVQIAGVGGQDGVGAGDGGQVGEEPGLDVEVVTKKV